MSEPLQHKATCLLVGCGGIGTIAALNLERGGLATVTAVLRSNYDHVQQHGFDITSVDHGTVKGFRPSRILNKVPDVRTDGFSPFDYIICTTKNIPDVPPTLVDLIRPSITPGTSTVVLIQNGLNIEKPLIQAFPTNTIISGTSFCESHQVGPGTIIQTDTDKVAFSAFNNPHLPPHQQQRAAQDFCAIYAAAGKCQAAYELDSGFARWRKLLYNACLNPICAITDLDTGRLQLAEHTVQNLVIPAMQEIRAAAKASGGHDLPEHLIPFMISLDRITNYNAPSMQQDIRARRFCEFENLVGEPMREGLAKGVLMPNITALYHILSAIQWGAKVKKGMIEIPPVEPRS